MSVGRYYVINSQRIVILSVYFYGCIVCVCACVTVRVFCVPFCVIAIPQLLPFAIISDHSRRSINIYHYQKASRLLAPSYVYSVNVRVLWTRVISICYVTP